MVEHLISHCNPGSKAIVEESMKIIWHPSHPDVVALKLRPEAVIMQTAQSKQTGQLIVLIKQPLLALFPLFEITHSFLSLL